MSDDGIEFVEEAGPAATPPPPLLRPDRNRSFAVRVVGTPDPDEVPIFVDLDTMRDMEIHAQEDRTIELGGVLLGHQVDNSPDGRFVLVTESLRAEHYRASRGTFEFTGQTWQTINRERMNRPTDLAMVGWYHTHPGWGVFLSHMDMFICNNFFNRPLDVALVIEPVELTRGWFSWDRRGRKRPARGYFVITSRYRERELDQFVEALDRGEAHLTPSLASPPESMIAAAGPAAVMGYDRTPPSWFSMGVLGLLAGQGVLLAVVLVLVMTLVMTDRDRRLETTNPGLPNDTAAEVAQLQSLRSALDDVFAEGGQTDSVVSRLQRQRDANRQLAAELSAVTTEARALDKQRQQLTSARAEDAKRITGYLADLRDLRQRNQALSARMKQLDPEGAADQAPALATSRELTIGLVMGVIGLAVGGLIVLVLRRAPTDPDDPTIARSGPRDADVDDT